MKISIITPSFNQGEFIERTLQSVACQSGAEIEHVVIDGGSTDETVDVLKHYDENIYWISEKDNGQADAVNKGIRATDGEIIGWLNSDDIYYPGTISRIVAFFKANPDIDVVYGMADHIDLDDQAFESYPSDTWDYERLKEVCFICQPALFLRRRVIVENGFLNESLSYCMDYEYWLRLGRAGVRFAYIEKKLAGSRLYENNKTLGSRVKVHREINDMLKNVLGKVPDRWLFNYVHALLGGIVVRDERPFWFMVRFVIISITSALKWNGRVTPTMASCLTKWGKSTLFRRKHCR